ncbi:hypothetical protein [Stutzerimonas azotifigens]|uniref:Uncharacterized protein n=1 Tax=Stutzerimonas azotifigens TaxID=291995 RepID=A0ABR5Z698_9GAMM|nr:hypothetical protein [Stutzerimonas azotifigens]MBA1275742.1 hypothetical protein [Stutzerimonas azotifigens]
MSTLIEILFLCSGAFAVLYKMRRSDLKVSDLFFLKSIIGGVPLKGGRKQRLIMDVLFYFFMFMSMVVVVVKHIAKSG